jgi:hypothetical protein
MPVQPAGVLQQQGMKAPEGSHTGPLDGDAVLGVQEAQQAAGAGEQQQAVEPLQQFEVTAGRAAEDGDIQHQGRGEERRSGGLGMAGQQLVHLRAAFAHQQVDAVLLLADAPGEVVQQRDVEPVPSAKAFLEVQLPRDPGEIPQPQATHPRRGQDLRLQQQDRPGPSLGEGGAEDVLQALSAGGVAVRGLVDRGGQGRGVGS